MSHTSTSSPSPIRIRRVRALLAVSLLALAACGTSGGSEPAAAPTTTEPKAAETTTTTEPKGRETTTTTAAEDPEDEPDNGRGAAAAGMPVDEDDAPSGGWIMVRWQTSQDPEPEGFTAGQADVRLYDIEPNCDGSSCDLAFAPGGQDGSFALPGLEPLTGADLEAQAGEEAWTSIETEEPYGCTAELDGPYVDSVAERALAPVRDPDGAIIALVGPTSFTDTVNEAGLEAGCPLTAEGTFEYQSVMVDSSALEGAPTFDVDTTFRQTLEVIASEGYTQPQLMAGGINVGQPDFDLTIDGTCDGGDCAVELTIPTGGTTVRDLELATADDDTLSAEFEDQPGCLDAATGEGVFDEGAYDDVGAYTDLVPIWVVDGEAQIFVGRYQSSATPTALGLTEPACSTAESLEGWVTWIDTGLIDD